MATKKGVPQPAAEPADSPAYTREELLANAEALFGVKPEVLTGALYGCEEQPLTIQQTERMIRQFQQRKVQL
ncbi:hypothetical protein [Paenibacillus flagellatus]|uniref:YqzN/YkzM domain-containing protein n=1 Tax=Paenibacillus flagellatus TaxID=2211139 RepID=A0A2V5K4E9_9BACL|nr:hypothetical protein [Paenibacillus flagellatus]PYI52543.1 hypothetical protein DLM86_20430 [Paenibacillus flagellatus]